MSEEKEKLLRLVARCSKKIAIEYENLFLKAKRLIGTPTQTKVISIWIAF